MPELQVGKWPFQVPMFRWTVIICALALGNFAHGQTNSAVPEQSGPVQGSQAQTNRPQTTSQTPRRGGRRPNGPPTLGLEQGTQDFDTPDFTLKLVKASQTVAALQPKGADGFDFTPADQLEVRAGDRYYHL